MSPVTHLLHIRLVSLIISVLKASQCSNKISRKPHLCSIHYILPLYLHINVAPSESPSRSSSSPPPAGRLQPEHSCHRLLLRHPILRQRFYSLAFEQVSLPPSRLGSLLVVHASLGLLWRPSRLSRHLRHRWWLPFL